MLKVRTDGPGSPNWVSTKTERASHRMEPLSYQGDPTAALDRLASIIAEMPGAKIVARDNTSVVATFTSRIFRFVDDVIFEVDDQSNQIHFSSSSRVGRSDLGANRKRMTTITTAWSSS